MVGAFFVDQETDMPVLAEATQMSTFEILSIVFVVVGLGTTLIVAMIGWVYSKIVQVGKDVQKGDNDIYKHIQEVYVQKTELNALEKAVDTGFENLGNQVEQFMQLVKASQDANLKLREDFAALLSRQATTEESLKHKQDKTT